MKQDPINIPNLIIYAIACFSILFIITMFAYAVYDRMVDIEHPITMRGEVVRNE